MKSILRRIFTWAAYSVSTLIVGVATAATASFVAANPTDVVNSLAPAVLAGVGGTLGAAFGALIVLRFKTVRTFIHELFQKD